MPENAPDQAVPEPGVTEPVNPSVRFERKDASVRGIAYFAVGVIGMALLAHVVASWVVEASKPNPPPLGPVRSLSSQDRIRLPSGLDKVPAPRLQTDQERDLAGLRERDAKLLDSYAWVDRKDGIVRIPIERALQLLSDPGSAAKHGVHSRPAPVKKGEGG
jgi:hypothetical protein